MYVCKTVENSTRWTLKKNVQAETPSPHFSNGLYKMKNKEEKESVGVIFQAFII